MSNPEPAYRARHGSTRTIREQRDQQRLATRRKLVDAAITVLARDGYVGARVEDIASEAGTSRATFYLHFRSKLEIVRRLMADLQRQSIDHYRELDHLKNPTWDDLRAWIPNLVDMWQQHRAEFLVLIEAVTVEPDLSHVYVEGINDISRAMSRHLDRWSGSGRQTALLRASMFTLQLERFCYFWKVRGEHFDEQDALTALTDSLWLALHPPTTQRPSETQDRTQGGQ